MEIVAAKSVDKHDIHTSFIEAFSDYQVKMDLPYDSFCQILDRNGFSPELSSIAIDNGKAVGFVLSGERQCTAYDIATAVVPSHRGQGLMPKLMLDVASKCRERNIEKYILEVISDNDKALRKYKALGFDINRNLECFSLEGTIPSISGDFDIRHDTSLLYEECLSEFWDYPPSWQNSFESIKAIPDCFDYIYAFDSGEPVGYCIADRKSKNIVQLAVRRDKRMFGYAAKMISTLFKEAPVKVKMNNIDSRNESLIGFLSHMGFCRYIKQYEMIANPNAVDFDQT